jgi:hypothetical protein
MKTLLSALALTAALFGSSHAADFTANCIVADPTGTPLNIRSMPNGPILGALYNGVTVLVLKVVNVNGKQWAQIFPEVPTNKTKPEYVYFNYLNCDTVHGQFRVDPNPPIYPKDRSQP